MVNSEKSLFFHLKNIFSQSGILYEKHQFTKKNHRFFIISTKGGKDGDTRNGHQKRIMQYSAGQ